MDQPRKSRPVTRRRPINHPTQFRETLAQVTPAPLVVTPPRVSNRNLRFGLIVIWVLAVVFAGIGIGRLILQAQQPAALASPGVPVANASIILAPLDTTDIVVTASVRNLDLAVTSASSIKQAQNGQPIKVMAANSYQSASSSDALQRFNHFGRPQGNIGTDPVQ